jgi:anti-sigma factor RsiW
MTCRQFGPDIVDLARGQALDPRREAAVLRHLRACVSCAARLEQQRAVSAALRRLATEGAQDDIPVNRDAESALVAAFAAAWSRPRYAKPRWGIPVAASVVLALGLALGWVYERPARSPAPATAVVASRAAAATPPAPAVVDIVADVQQGATRQPVDDRTGRGRPGRRAVLPADPTPFVVWSGASAGPRFESGELIRVEIPESVLPLLGLWPSASRDGVIQADVLVGQDGLARAVRLVQ